MVPGPWMVEVVINGGRKLKELKKIFAKIIFHCNFQMGSIS